MPHIAGLVGGWAASFEPTENDLALAQRALIDTLAVALAARDHPVNAVAARLSEAGRWAVAAHVLDYDDLHLPSTSHVSAVCVPAVLAKGGTARAYLAAAGAMSRIGIALGWRHYAAGWHATCTAGALGAAVGAGVAAGLDAAQLATALALAVPGAGGVQRAFGTDAKALQVGFAVETGVRAAELAAAGATADPAALDAWLQLVGGSAANLDFGGPAVPGGLAIKLYPACYALQRPISALLALAEPGDTSDILEVRVRTTASSLQPLIHHQPRTGLQAKFSLEYAIATALLDRPPGLAAFTDDAVARPQATRLAQCVRLEVIPGGDNLLAGEVDVSISTRSGDLAHTRLKYPPGSPQCPPSDVQLATKVADCIRGLDVDPAGWTWTTAPDVLRHALSAG